MLAFKILISTIVVWFSVVQCDDNLKSVLEKQNAKLNDLEEKLEVDFGANTKDAFWAHKQRVDKMFQDGHEQHARQVLNMVQLATLVQSLRYAILRKTISATRDIINHRFVQNGQGFLDTRAGVVVLPPMVPVLVSRAIQRGYIDGSRFVDNTWNWLHLVMEHYYETIPVETRQVANQAYKQRTRFLGDSQEASNEYLSTLKGALDEVGIHEGNSASIVSVFDRIINEAMQCSHCAPTNNGHLYVTGPMFDDDSAVGAAVEHFVDPDLQLAFTDIDDVYFPGPEAQAKVTREQIDNLMRKILANE